MGFQPSIPPSWKDPPIPDHLSGRFDLLLCHQGASVLLGCGNSAFLIPSYHCGGAVFWIFSGVLDWCSPQSPCTGYQPSCRYGCTCTRRWWHPGWWKWSWAGECQCSRGSCAWRTCSHRWTRIQWLSGNGTLLPIGKTATETKRSSGVKKHEKRRDLKHSVNPSKAIFRICIRRTFPWNY